MRIALLTLLTLAVASFGCDQPVTRGAEDALAPQTRPSTPEVSPAERSDDVAGGYAALLRELVTPAGLVRYGLLDDTQRLARLRAVVAWHAHATRPEGAAEQIAFYCNAYNANVLLMAWEASQRAGFTTVKDVPGFFDRDEITVAGERLTLNALENGKIRPLGDARIHAALVCAARSCPPLRGEPFSGARLDGQLDDQCRRWVNDAAKFRVAGGQVGASEILKWYAADFRTKQFPSVVAFVRAYADPSGPLGRLLDRTPDPSIMWLPYDWALNRADGGS